MKQSEQQRQQAAMLFHSILRWWGRGCLLNLKRTAKKTDNVAELPVNEIAGQEASLTGNEVQ
ncbi:MAG: hypothetical protein A2X85_11330 [Geobacteraceae bacterium GWF2_54_21]|nr:MAG: hypothetical protein A2X85_11330 [Geobacteraceae bacterium GWF2_54_21]